MASVAPAQGGEQIGDAEIDAMLDSLPEQVKLQAVENPQLLEQIIAENLFGAKQ